MSSEEELMKEQLAEEAEYKKHWDEIANLKRSLEDFEKEPSEDYALAFLKMCARAYEPLATKWDKFEEKMRSKYEANNEDSYGGREYKRKRRADFSLRAIKYRSMANRTKNMFYEIIKTIAVEKEE